MISSHHAGSYFVGLPRPRFGGSGNGSLCSWLKNACCLATPLPVRSDFGWADFSADRDLVVVFFATLLAVDFLVGVFLMGAFFLVAVLMMLCLIF